MPPESAVVKLRCVTHLFDYFDYLLAFPVSSCIMPSSLAVARVAQESWDIIVYKLPAVDARSAAAVFGFQLRPEQIKHSDLWSSIFQDGTWISKATTEFNLNPILIGCDLNLICDPVDRQQGQSRYLILVSGDPTGDIQYQKDVFLISLRPHSFDKGMMEVTFASGLILNIDDIYWDHEIIRAKLKRIFSYRHRQL